MKIAKIEDAKRVLEPIISKTPLVHATKIHDNLWIKAENLQGTGCLLYTSAEAASDSSRKLADAERYVCTA